MLKKIVHINLKIVGIILLILIALQTITAYFFGIMAEKQFKSQFQQMSDSGFIKVVNYKYNRGWFLSSENVVLQLNTNTLSNISTLLPIKLSTESNLANESNVYQLSYNTSIVNGIFAGWIYGNFMPTLAYEKAKIIIPDSLAKYVQTFFKDETPLTLTSVIYINGSGKYQLYSPEFNYEEALSGVKIKWDGAKLVVKFNKEFNSFNNKLEIPGLDFYAPTKGSIVLNNFEYISDTHRSVNEIKVGDTSLLLSKISVQLEESDISKKFKLGDMVSKVIGINAAEFLNDVEFFNPANFTLSNVSYQSHSTDENNYFNSDVKAGFDKLSSESKDYGPFNFDFSLNHIRADKFTSVANLLESMTTIENPTDEQKEQFSRELKNEMTPILMESPVATINKVTLQMPSGLMSIDGLVTTHGFESKDMEDQSNFIDKIYATANIAVPKPVLSYLLFLQMKYFLSAGNAELDEESSKSLSELVNILLDNQLHVWLHKNYLSDESGIIKTKFKLDNGVVYLNDNPTNPKSTN